MPTVTIGYSVPYFYADANPYKPASTSGTGNVWETDTVNGYTTCWVSRRAPFGVVDWAVADLDPVDLPTAVGSISLTAVLHTFLFNELNATGSRYQLAFLEDLDTDEGLYVTPGGDGFLTANVDGWQHSTLEVHPSAQTSLFEFHDLITGDLASPEYVRQVFANGCVVALYRLGITGDPIPADYGIRVSFLRLDLIWTAGGKAPICRGYPRHGAGGNSSPRAYPPSKARQGSPRATGYY